MQRAALTIWRSTPHRPGLPGVQPPSKGAFRRDQPNISLAQPRRHQPHQRKHRPVDRPGPVTQFEYRSHLVFTRYKAWLRVLAPGDGAGQARYYSSTCAQPCHLLPRGRRTGRGQPFEDSRDIEANRIPPLPPAVSANVSISLLCFFALRYFTPNTNSRDAVEDEKISHIGIDILSPPSLSA